MRKFLAYMMTYVLMLFMGFGGVFLFTDRSSPSQAGVINNEPSAMDKLVTNLTNSKSISLNGQFDVVNEQELVSQIGINLSVNLLSGFDELSLDGVVNIGYNGTREDIKFSFVNNKIYLSMFGANLVFSTSDVGELIGVIAGVVKQFVPNFNLEGLLDVNSLMNLMTNIVEQKGENSIDLKLTTDFGDVIITTDLDYNIQKVTIPTITVENIDILSTLNLSTSNEFEDISEPSDAELYENITEEINLVKALVNTFSSEFAFNGNFNEINLSGARKNSNLFASLSYKDYSADFTLFEKTAYLQFSNIKLKTDANDISNLFKVVEKYVDNINTVDLTQVALKLLDELKNIDLNKIDLSQIAKIITVDEKGIYHIKVNDFDIALELFDSKISKITTNLQGNDLALNFEYANEIEINKPSGEFIELSKFVNQIDAVVQTLMSENVNIVASVDYLNYEVNLNANYSYNNGNIYLNAEINFDDFVAQLYFVNNTLYLQYQGIKIKADENTFNELLNTLPISADKQIIQNVVLKALKILSQTNINLIDNILTINTDGLLLNVITNDGKVSNIECQANDLQITSQFTYNSFDKELPVDSEFVSAEKLVNIIKNTYNLINEPIYLNVNVNNEDFSISGYVSFVENNLKAQLKLTISEYEINLTIINETVYAEVLNAKVKFNLNDIQTVIDFVKSLNIEVPELSNLPAFEVKDILNLVACTYLQLDENSLSITYEDYNVSINFANEVVSSINVSSPLFNANLTTTNEVKEISVDSESYLDLVTLLPFIKSVYNTVLSQNYSGNIALTTSYNNTLINFNIEYKVKLVDGKVVANAVLRYQDYSADIYFKDNTIYVNVNDIHIKANVNELDKVVNFVTEQFNLTTNNIDTKQILQTILGIFNIEDLSFVNTISINENTFTINVNGLKVNVEFNETINYVSIELNELTIDNVTLNNTFVEIGVNTEKVKIAVPTYDYVNIVDIVETANAVINTVKDNAISGQIEVVIKDENIVNAIGKNTITLDYNYSYNDGNIKLDLSTQILNDTLLVVLKDNVIYLSYQGIKVKTSLQDLMSYLPAGDSNINISAVISQVLASVSLGYSNNTLSLNYNDTNLQATIGITTLENYVTKVSAETPYANVAMSVNKQSIYNDITLTNDYVEVSNLIELINNIIEMTKGDIYTTFELSINEMKLQGVLNYHNNEISAQVTTKLFNKDLMVRLIDNIIYVDYDGLKVKLNVSDISKVIELVEEITGTQMQGVSVIASEQSIKDIVLNLLNNIYLTYNGNEIVITLNYNLNDYGIDLSNIDLSILGLDITKLANNQLNVAVDCTNNTVNSVNAQIEDMLAIDVKIFGNLQAINENTSGYLDLVTLLPFVKSVYNTVVSQNYSGNIAITTSYNNTLINFNIEYKVKLVDGKVVANAVLRYQDYSADIYFKDNTIYVNVNDIHIKANVNELDKVVNFVTEQFNLTTNNIDTKQILQTILGIFNIEDLSFVNTISINENTFTINVNGLKVNVEFNETINYVSIELNELTIDNVTLNNTFVEIGVNTEKVKIAVPTYDYVNIVDIVETANAVINTVKDNAISGQIEVVIKDENIVNAIGKNTITLDYNYSYNDGNIKLDLSTQILNDTLLVVLKDNVIYLSYQGIKVKTSLQDLMSYLPAGDSNINISAVISQVLASVSLGYSNNTLSLNYNDTNLQATIGITTLENYVTKVSAETPYANVAMSVNKQSIYNDITLTNDYVEVSNLIELINNIIEMTKGDIYTTFELSINEMKLQGVLNYHNNEISAQVTTKLFNKDLMVRLIDNIIYVDYDGLKVKLNVSDISKVIELVEEITGTQMQGVSVIASEQSIKDIVLNLLNNIYLTYNGNEIVITLNYNLNDYGIDLSNIDLSILGLDITKLANNQLNVAVDCTNNTVNSVNAQIEDMLAIDVKIFGNLQAINENTSGYLDLVTLLPFVKTIFNTYLSNGISGKVEVNIPQIEQVVGSVVVDYKINFNNGLLGHFETTILGKVVKIDIADNKIYLQIDDFKYYFAFNEIEEIINTICEKFNLNIDSNVTFYYYLGNLKIEVLNDNELQIAYNDFTLYLSKANDIVLNVEYNGNAISLTIKNGLNKIDEVTNDYLHIDSLLNKVFNIYDLVNNGNVQININTNIQGQEVDIVANINFEQFMLTQNINDLVVDAQVNLLNKVAQVKFLNSTVYLSVDGLNVKFNINDIDLIMQFINKHFGELNLNNQDIDLNTLIKFIASTEDSLSLNLNEFGSINMLFNNDILRNIVYEFNEYTINIELDYENPKIEVILQENYSNIVELLPLGDKILEIYNSKAISLDAVLNANLLGSLQQFNASINVDFSSNINIDFVTTLEGVEVALHLRGNILYLDIYGLKIKLVESDLVDIVEFLNSNFNLSLVAPELNNNNYDGALLIDFINKNFNLSINTSGNTFSLGQIGSWVTFENVLEWTLKDGTTIKFDLNNLPNFKLFGADFSASAELLALGQNVVLSEIETSDYVAIQKILDEVQSIINTIKLKQYDIVADAKVYNSNNLRFDAQIDASLSILNGIYFNGFANLTGEQDIAVKLDYDNEYLYLNYDGLKVKINKQNLKEIAGIVLSVLGVDISSISIFENIDFDFNLDNVTSIMPNIDFGNPLSLLKVIKSLNYEDGKFFIDLDAKYITNSDYSNVMKVSFITNNGSLTNITLDNIYTSDVEYFNLDIAFSEFTGFNPVTDNYIDLSSASLLLKGIVNTSELTNYHITGNMNIAMNALGIDINWNVPYDIQIKLVDKKIVAMANVGPMPVVPAVNNDVPYKAGDTVSGIYCGLDRKLTIYYIDGYVYFYRTEKVPVFASSPRTYEKKLKVALETVLQNPMKYMQYALGFTDDIMQAIADSMELSQNRENPIDLGNVLLAFDHNDDYYNLTINLGEISNNPQLDTMYVGIKTSYVEGAGKEYTTDLKFNMHMPFTDNIVMDLTTNDMKLVDINSELDFSALYNYVNSYSYNEDEEWEASKGNWQLANAILYTISFNTNGGEAVNNISQSANTAISIPTLNNKVVDEGDVRKTYRFDGWYTTENFEEGTLFTSTTMPRYDLTLYAKWTLISTLQVRTIYFESNGGSAVNSQKYLPNTYVDLSAYVPTKATYYVDKGYNWGGSHMGKWTYEVTRYTFAGWYIDANCTQAFNGVMPDYDITLYAKWNASTTTEYYYNWERP